MDGDDRPEIRALIGFRFPCGQLWLSPWVFTLAEAAEASQRGFAILVDPADEQELERWLDARRPRMWNKW